MTKTFKFWIFVQVHFIIKGQYFFHERVRTKCRLYAPLLRRTNNCKKGWMHDFSDLKVCENVALSVIESFLQIHDIVKLQLNIWEDSWMLLNVSIGMSRLNKYPSKIALHFAIVPKIWKRSLKVIKADFIMHNSTILWVSSV